MEFLALKINIYCTICSITAIFLKNDHVSIQKKITALKPLKSSSGILILCSVNLRAVFSGLHLSRSLHNHLLLQCAHSHFPCTKSPASCHNSHCSVHSLFLSLTLFSTRSLRICVFLPSGAGHHTETPGNQPAAE